MRNPLRVIDRRAAGASSGRHLRHGRKPACSASCGVPEESAIRPLRRPCRTNRATIHARRRDPDEEHAIEPGIAGSQGRIQLPAVVFHPPTIRQRDQSIQPFSDIAIVRFTCPNVASEATPPTLYSTRIGRQLNPALVNSTRFMQQTEDPDDQ